MSKMSTFRYDLYRSEGARSKRWHVKWRKILFTPGCAYIYFFRHASEARFGLTKAFWATLLHATKIITGIQIPIGTKIDRGLRILHFGTIVVNPRAQIGKNFNIAQGVLIGNSEGKKAGVPILGDNCYCGANAIIIGGCRIGNDVLIAPGAFVNFDVPDNSIVIGNPGHIIPRDSSPTKKYIVYPVEDYDTHS